MTEKLADTISGTVLLLVAAVMGVMAHALPTTITDQYAGPGFMPTLLSIALAACGAAIVVKSQAMPTGRRMPGWTGADLAGAARIAVVLAATAAYNLFLEPAGFLLVTLPYLVFLLWFFKVSWRTNLIISVASTVATYAMFTVWLKVILPMGLLDIYF